MYPLDVVMILMDNLYNGGTLVDLKNMTRTAKRGMGRTEIWYTEGVI